MGRLGPSGWTAILLCVPPAALAGAWLSVLAIASAGRHPLWHLEPGNLAEAAVFRDGGAIARRIHAGEDPDRPGTVRPGFIANEASTLTPVEAAAAARQADALQLLLDLGASPDEGSWRRAWCASDDADVRQVLARHRPQNAAPACAGGTPP